VLKFPGDVIGKVFVSTGCKRNYTMRSVFYGTEGTIICDNTSPTIQLFETNEELGTKYSRDPQQLPVEINNHNATEEIRVFVEALVKGEKMPISSAEGAYTVAVCRAVLKSVKSGMPEAVEYPEV
jgi:predicted dehydrogenase